MTEVNVGEIARLTWAYLLISWIAVESKPMNRTCGQITYKTLPVTRRGYGNFLLEKGSSCTCRHLGVTQKGKSDWVRSMARRGGCYLGTNRLIEDCSEYQYLRRLGLPLHFNLWKQKTGGMREMRGGLDYMNANLKTGNRAVAADACPLGIVA